MRLSYGHYVSLAKLRPNALDPDIETQFPSERDVSLTMASLPEVKLINDIETFMD